MPNKTIFEKIIDREIPSKIYAEDEKTITIWDIDQSIQGHLLVIWKEPIVNLISMEDSKVADFFSIANINARKFISKEGYKAYQLHIANGTEAGQEVMHAHIHIKPYK